MEGDAGTRQLNPTESDAEGSPESTEVTQEVPTDDPDDPADPAENTDSSSSETASSESTSGDTASSDQEPAENVAAPRRPERFGRGWVAGICAVLVLIAAGLATGGFLALRADAASAAIEANDQLALQRAMDCVAATQAPDVSAMAAAQSKIIECSTGDFAVQATLFSSMLVEAYQYANVSVKVADMRAATERHNDDGSVDVLVAFRIEVTNSESADRVQGFRLRVNMAPADGTYRVARLDQVTQ